MVHDRWWWRDLQHRWIVFANGKASLTRTIGGTIGQPDAGSLSGGSYTLNGGFWAGASIANYTIYLPLVRK